jgi:hypothetical protein
MIDPAIVHFLGYYTELWPYRAEMLKLNLVMERGVPREVARLLVDSSFSVTHRGIDMARNAGRPLYRLVFGTRPVKKSERVVA